MSKAFTRENDQPDDDVALGDDPGNLTDGVADSDDIGSSMQQSGRFDHRSAVHHRGEALCLGASGPNASITASPRAKAVTKVRLRLAVEGSTRSMAFAHSGNDDCVLLRTYPIESEKRM